jgi:enamine deaminase RidA (YjgF/YER057c/UK114 family)
VSGLRWASREVDRGEIASGLEEALAALSLGIENVALVQGAVAEGDLAAVEREIAASFSGPPPCHLVSQANAGECEVALLLWLYEGAVSRNGSVASVGGRGGRLYFVDGISAPPGDVVHQWARCFERLEETLAEAGLASADLVKVWTYYGDSGGEQHFQQFSAYRNRLFSALPFPIGPDSGGGGFPASTGVSVRGRSALGGIAASGAVLEAVSNPLQTDPYRYGPPMLPASFSRAVAVELEGERLLLVSGTASVTGSSIAHEGDLTAQVEQVLTLLEALAREAAEGGEVSWGHLTVYVRDREQAAVVRSLIEARHSGVPRLLVIAPLSRPSLLVEVDAAAIVRLEQGPTQ